MTGLSLTVGSETAAGGKSPGSNSSNFGVLQNSQSRMPNKNLALARNGQIT